MYSPCQAGSVAWFPGHRSAAGPGNEAMSSYHWLLQYSVLTSGTLILIPLQWYCEADGSVCGEKRSPVSGQAHDAGTGERSPTCTLEVEVT